MGKKRKHDPSATTKLTTTEINEFKKKGFVLFKNAFDPQVAKEAVNIIWNRLKLEHGIDQHEPATWPQRVGIPDIYMENSGYPWNQVLNANVKNAVDQLCGKHAWEPFGCGWWVINFPGPWYEEPWGAAGKWHVDGAKYVHHCNSKESGLVPMFLFNDTEVDAGGTALSVGSHVDITQILLDHEPKGLKGGHLSKLAIANNVHKRPMEQIVGKAGDIMFVHPFLLHARSKNLGKNGAESVRFLCNPNVQLKNKMKFNAKKIAKQSFKEAIHSPLELSILNYKSDKMESCSAKVFTDDDANL